MDYFEDFYVFPDICRFCDLCPDEEKKDCMCDSLKKELEDNEHVDMPFD